MKLSKYVPIITLFCFLLFIVLIAQNVYAYGSPNKFCFDKNMCDVVGCTKTIDCLDIIPGCMAKCAFVEGESCPSDSLCPRFTGERCGYEPIIPMSTLTASPNSGYYPLTVQLTANLNLLDVSGYMYWFDCNGDKTWEVEGQSSNKYTCVYSYDPNITYPKTYTAKAGIRYYTDCAGDSMSYPTTTITVTIPPTVSCTLDALNPSSGYAPLNDVDLKATVGGTATGNIVYKFDCNNDGTYEYTSSAISTNPYTRSDLCDYANSGTYTAKAQVTRQGVTNTCTKTITVTAAPTVSCSVSVNPDLGTAPLNDVDVKATVGGTATGDIVYQFDCNNDGTYEYTSSATSYNPYTRSDLCDYANSGTYTVKVRVTRQGVSATCTNTVTVKSLPVVDIKARQSGSGTYSNGPITIGYNSKADLQWTATNATSCIASGDWSGSKASSGTNTETTGNLFTDKSYTITCSNGAGGTDSDSVIVNVSDPTLFVAFSADKTSGSSPLTGVTFTATVSGSAIGTINYTFYCNRNDSGTNITTPYSYKIDGTNINPLTLANTCDSVYTAPGTYYAKMIVERDSATPVEARITIVVTNNPPTATNLKVVPSNACLVAPYYACSWTYTDPDNDDESQFLFQVDDNSDFSSPVIDRTIDIDFPSPSSNNQPAILSTIPSPDHILFNTRYYWRVKVVDAYGMSSAWVNGASFITPLHHSPIVRFTNKPLRPIVHELTWFTDDSRCFDDSPTGGDCAITSGDSFNWTFVNGNPATSTKEIEITEFTVPGTSSSAKLQVTDSDGFTCSLTKSIKVNFPPPIWKEVRPTD